MAKSKAQKQAVKEKPYPYPSRFGSHRSMIVTTLSSEADSINEDTGVLCLEDEFGLYFTPTNRIDSGLADPNRYTESRLNKLYEKTKDKEHG